MVGVVSGIVVSNRRIRLAGSVFRVTPTGFKSGRTVSEPDLAF